jgi:FlaA1/EpsC-like NDP-sugar epimerase
MARVFDVPRRTPLVPSARIVCDLWAWALALPLALYLRFDFAHEQVVMSLAVEHLAVAAVAQVAVGFLVGLYRRRWIYGSFEEVVALTATVLVTGLVLMQWEMFVDAADLPRSIPVLSTALTLLFTLVLRSVWRVHRIRVTRPLNAEPIVVIGAGQGAGQIVRTLLNDPLSPYRPIALLDDDPLKSRLRIHGVPVEGPLHQLEHVATTLGVSTVLLAIPSGDSEIVRRVTAMAEAAGLRLLVLPAPKQMLWNPTLSDIRPLTDDDLLGRECADIDPQAVMGYITGKRVLVTGAGGSIGSELCRQLVNFAPAELIMLDRDESGLLGVQLSIEGRAMLDTPNIVLADIRDEGRVREVFDHYRPDVVFHAAALKHMPLLERHPDEAWKTNVVGTQNVLEAARAIGVDRFINISTDKAADPINVLGYSKRLTERLTAASATMSAGMYASVRFGNVLGSRGSVLTVFRAQSEVGGPLTVTDPDVTRYFMTIEEAVRLTLFAGAIGSTGDVLVLDMGEPVRILDVARRFAEQHSPPLDIVFTHLRPGEKLHEVLVAADEPVDPRFHRMISHAPVPPVLFEDLADVVAVRGATVECLRSMTSVVKRAEV